MIAWLLARPRLIAYGLAGAALAGGVAWAVHDVRSAYAARRALPIARAERDAANASLAAMVEAAKLTGAVLGRAEDRVAETAKAAGKVRVIYREAVRNDPDCATWSREPVRCPLGGLPAAPVDPGGDVPQHTGVPR